jgi:Berberine and berberine like
MAAASFGKMPTTSVLRLISPLRRSSGLVECSLVRWAVADYGAALRPWARRAYVNYLGPSAPERIREIYGANYPRLARIKARYDPQNLFRSNQNILPASSS